MTIPVSEVEKMFGKRYLGPEAFASSSPFRFAINEIPKIPYAEETLKRYAETHLLVFGPSAFADGTPVTLNAFRTLLGVDPAAGEPCMYNQDWYLRELFAAERTPGERWHLIQKDAREDLRTKQPDDIQASLAGNESFPSAITCALAFFTYWYATGGERLWNHDFVWCNDRDHNGDRIYVGRYEDPTGVNKNGFNVHRYLTLRSSYSAVTEVPY
jgi:hypothetical protein